MEKELRSNMVKFIVRYSVYYCSYNAYSSIKQQRFTKLNRLTNEHIKASYFHLDVLIPLFKTISLREKNNLAMHCISPDRSDIDIYKSPPFCIYPSYENLQLHTYSLLIIYWHPKRHVEWFCIEDAKIFQAKKWHKLTGHICPLWFCLFLHEISTI